MKMLAHSCVCVCVPSMQANDAARENGRLKHSGVGSPGYTSDGKRRQGDPGLVRCRGLGVVREPPPWRSLSFSLVHSFVRSATGRIHPAQSYLAPLPSFPYARRDAQPSFSFCPRFSPIFLQQQERQRRRQLYRPGVVPLVDTSGSRVPAAAAAVGVAAPEFPRHGRRQLSDNPER